jgi:hypothetical protein
MDPKELLRQLLAQQEAIVKTAKDGKRDLTADEQKNFDDLQKKIEAAKAEIKMAEERAAGGSPAHTPNAADEAKRAVDAERQRTAEITSMCRDFNMSPDKFVADGVTVEQARAAVLDELKKTAGPVGVRMTRDEGDKFRAAAVDALSMRSGVVIAKAADGATELRGMSLRDLAIECMTREGRNAGELLRMDRDALFAELQRQFFNPTAAFPAILDATINKNIVQAYQSVPTTFQAWTTRGSVSDFKSTPDHSYLIGGAGDFLLVPENGELKHDKPSTALLPQRKIDTYGRQFSMSRQAFINDDIGFLAEVPGLYAASAKKTIDKQVYTILYGNPAIYDGVTLFDDTNHKNVIGSGAAPSQTTIQAIILKAQKQKDPFDEPIYMTPKFIIVGVGYEFTLAVVFGSAQVTGGPNNDINPLYNYPLQVVQTPVLNALAGSNACPWFMVTDPMSAKSLQVDYLNGQETPTIRRSEVPGVLGYVWDIYLDWGVAVRDYRGIYKNPGAVIS